MISEAKVNNKVKVYDQDQKFQYLLYSISPEFIKEFKALGQKAKGKLYNLMTIYRHLPPVFTNSDIEAFTNSPKDVSRIGLMLCQAYLVEKTGKSSFKKIEAAETDIGALELLITHNKEILGYGHANTAKTKRKVVSSNKIDQFSLLRDKYNKMHKEFPTWYISVEDFVRLYFLLKE